MRLDLHGEWQITVTLSERNFQALAHKLDMPGSARTLVSRNAFRNGRQIDDLLLVVKADPNATEPRVTVDSDTVVIVLDRRTIEGMLSGPHRMDDPLSSVIDDVDYRVCLRWASDALHYGERGFGPGLMHPETERFITGTTSSEDSTDPAPPGQSESQASDSHETDSGEAGDE